MRRTAAIAVVLACAACSPEATVEKFYRETNGILDSGVRPTESELRRAAPFFSTRMNGLLAGAVAERTRSIREHGPNEKPPWSEGFRFTSVDEGFKRFAVDRVVPRPDGMYDVHVKFWYDRDSWEDVAIVKREWGRYVIDDLKFNGETSLADELRQP